MSQRCDVQIARFNLFTNLTTTEKYITLNALFQIFSPRISTRHESFDIFHKWKVTRRYSSPLFWDHKFTPVFLSILTLLLLWLWDFQLVKFFAFLQSVFVDGLMNAGQWPSCSQDLSPCHFRCEAFWGINITAIILPLEDDQTTDIGYALLQVLLFSERKFL